MAVADHRHGLDFAGRRGDEPVHPGGYEPGGEKFPPVSQDHAVQFRLEVDDVEGFPGGDPQAPALPHGVAFQAAMPAQEAPLGVDEIAG